MKKIILVHGLIAGFILGVFMVLSNFLPYFKDHGERGMIYGYTSMILAFSLIFVGVKNFRDKYNNGTISFGEAFKIGLLISLIGSTMYVLVWMVEFHFFIPDYMDKYAAQAVKNLQSSGLSQAKLDAKLKDIDSMKEMYKNPVWVFLFTYLEVLPVGLLISLICSLILKKKKPDNKVAFAN